MWDSCFKKKCKDKKITKLSIYFQTTKVLETATNRRKIVSIRDSSASIEIKLWGQQFDVLNFQVGTKTSLNTNMSTTLEDNAINNIPTLPFNLQYYLLDAFIDIYIYLFRKIIFFL